MTIIINTTMQNAAVAVGAIVALAIVLGAGLIFADYKFAVKMDPREEKLVSEILPGYNCGACGFPGCAGYATSLVEGNKDHTKCRPGGADVKTKIDELMG